jgi:hypothetical protein
MASASIGEGHVARQESAVVATRRPTGVLGRVRGGADCDGSRGPVDHIDGGPWLPLGPRRGPWLLVRPAARLITHRTNERIMCLDEWRCCLIFDVFFLTSREAALAFAGVRYWERA